MEAAFFDLDKTVIAKASMVAFGPPLYRAGMISRWLVARALWSQFVFQRVGADEEQMRKFRESALRITRGWDQARISAIVRDTLTEVIDPIVYDEALELIRDHQAAGRRVYIISASPEEIVTPLALYLGVDEAIASRARLDDDGRYTGEVEFYSYGPFKADAIVEAARLHDIDLAASYAYSDSATDLPMLEIVGHPVVVNPDRELARIARERDWEVRLFRNGVPLRERVSMPPPGRTAAGVASVALVIGGVAAGWWLLRRGRADRRPRPDGPISYVRPRAASRPRCGRRVRRSGVLQLLHRKGSKGDDDDEDQELLHGRQHRPPPGGRVEGVPIDLTPRSPVKVRLPRADEKSIAASTTVSNGTFARALSDRVELRLDEPTLAFAFRRLHRKAAVIATWYVLSYVLMLTATGWVEGTFACISLAFAMAAVGFNIQHDANHNAFFPAGGSKRLTLANRTAGWSIHAIGASSSRWIDGHVFAHHGSPNVVGKDSDIELRPFARLAPSQAHHPWHRLQHLYLWPLYGFTAVSIIVADVVSTVAESFTGDRRGRRPTAHDYAVLMGTKSVFLVAMLGVPLLLHPAWVVAVGATAVLTITGILLGIVFQLAHAVTEAAFCEDGNRPEGRWHEWQVRTSVDFCHGDGVADRALTWFTGGLNYQTEHHLFPRLPHTAYPFVAPIVAEICAEHSIRHHVQPSLGLALRSHYRHVRELGRPLPA